MSRDDGESLVERRPAAALVGPLLAGGAWTLFVLYAWMLVPVACERSSPWLLHLAAGVAVLLALSGLFETLRRRHPEEPAAGTASQLRVVAISLSSLFVAGTALFWIFAAALDPCWR